ncbi:MAG: hypothetical protein ACREFP_01700 [Acetobacteraceae bacterium]
MDGIVKLAATVLPELVALERVRTAAPHIILQAVLSLLALGAAAGALGCGIAALWIGLLPAIGPWAAPLACGGVLLLATIILIVILIVLSRNHDRSKATSGTIAKAIESGDVTPVIRPLMRENKWLLITLAVVAGMIAANKDHPRKP